MAPVNKKGNASILIIFYIQIVNFFSELAKKSPVRGPKADWIRKPAADYSRASQSYTIQSRAGQSYTSQFAADLQGNIEEGAVVRVQRGLQLSQEGE